MQFTSRWGRRVDIPDLRRAYRQLFRNPVGSGTVLPDILEFCRAGEQAPRDGDLFVQGRHAGRQDVWLHIQEYLHLSDDELWQMRRGQMIEVKGVEG